MSAARFVRPRSSAKHGQRRLPARALEARRILFQCPASFTPTKEHVEDMLRFFASIDRDKEVQFLWEPRGSDWAEELVRKLCRELDLVHVVDPFSAKTQTPESCYYRLHGRAGDWRYIYTDDELEELASMLPKDKFSYVLFNNVRMREDATRFQKLV